MGRKKIYVDSTIKQVASLNNQHGIFYGSRNNADIFNVSLEDSENGEFFRRRINLNEKKALKQLNKLQKDLKNMGINIIIGSIRRNEEVKEIKYNLFGEELK